MNPLTITNTDGSVEILYEPSPLQAEFHSRAEPNVLFYGNRGGGKSLALRWDAHLRALTSPGFRYCILRRTYPQLEESHLIHISNEMKKLGGTFHQTQKKAYYPNGSVGTFSHCATEEDVLNLLSAEYAWMGFDELSTFPWEMFNKLAFSVRVKKESGLTAMVRACTNPLGISAQDINKYFILKDVDPEEDPDYKPEDWHAIKVQAEDNSHIDLQQYRKRFAGISGHTRKAWVDGEFSLENALFDFYPMKRVEATGEVFPYHVIPDIELNKIIQASEIYRAIDMGYFPDPAYCLWIAHLGNRFIAFHEELYYKQIAADIADDIREKTKEMGITRVVNTFCDPSMDIHTPADIRTIKDIIESHGVPLETSINNRELYASAVHTALSEEPIPGVPRLQIYQHGKQGCPYLVKTIPQQRYNPKHPLAMDDQKDDHAVVTLAYFLISGTATERRSLSGSGMKTKPWMKPKLADRWVLGQESVKEKSRY